MHTPEHDQAATTPATSASYARPAEACVTCGASLPQFPAFIYDSTRTPPVSGPYCDEHVVLTGTGEQDA